MSRDLNTRTNNLIDKINSILGMGNNSSSVGRINYTDVDVLNPAYDFTKGGVQYEELPEGTFIGPDDYIIRKDASSWGPVRGLWGALDTLTRDKWDFDRSGPGVDHWGKRRAAPGTLGGLPIEIKPKIPNENFDLSKATAAASGNPVPNIGSGLSVGKLVQDAYSGWRDNRLKAREADRNLLYNKIANEYAYQLDKAQMYDYMNSPMGQARTNLMTQQGFAIPRIAKAALIEARAKAQDAANEFGQSGLKRTYFTG